MFAGRHVTGPDWNCCVEYECSTTAAKHYEDGGATAAVAVVSEDSPRSVCKVVTSAPPFDGYALQSGAEGNE